MVNGVALKWLERMEELIRWRKPRIIGVMVDGNKPFDDEAVAELLKPFDVQPEDTVVAVNRFACVEGLPRAAATT
jgi:hypothetical protein